MTGDMYNSTTKVDLCLLEKTEDTALLKGNFLYMISINKQKNSNLQITKLETKYEKFPFEIYVQQILLEYPCEVSVRIFENVDPHELFDAIVYAINVFFKASICRDSRKFSSSNINPKAEE